jgi:hypothetical protein
VLRQSLQELSQQYDGLAPPYKKVAIGLAHVEQAVLSPGREHVAHSELQDLHSLLVFSAKESLHALH